MTRMSADVQKELRRRYEETWGKPWPEEDSFLSELWFEAKDALGVSPKSKRGGREIKEFTLELMKENTKG